MTTYSILFSLALIAHTLAAETNNPNRQTDGTLLPLSAEESLRHIEVPDGYNIELVASEPMVQEPVCFTFDPQGALFVCEWNTYMQDQYGTGQDQPVCRIVKLTDTNGDGKMDHRSVFADKLLMPRSILALHDRILVRLSHNDTIYAFFDSNKDGVADKKTVAYQGRKVGGNIEHQDNALVWNADNRIYATGQIYHYNAGTLELQKNFGRYGQWGLTRDDLGRIYGSGNSIPVKGWHSLGGFPILTPHSDPKIYQAHFTCDVDDATDPGRNVTSTGGQTIIRSPQLQPFYGMYAIPDPVRRMVKLVDFHNNNGTRSAVVPKGFETTEFIRSADTYFRPVWTDMGPDGALYIADMSRGIIQESQWFPTERTKDPNQRWLERYHRTKDWGMLQVNSRGRIYRLVPDDKSLLDPQPKLNDLSSKQLVSYLSHPNAWWRDTAHKLIVLRNDNSALPALRQTLTHKQPLARLLSMRCLQAYDALTLDDLTNMLADSNENVRTHAVAIATEYLPQYKELQSPLLNMLNDPSPLVIDQLYASFSTLHSNTWLQARKQLVQLHPHHSGIKLQTKHQNALPHHLKKFKKAAETYAGFCVDCHGDGINGLRDDSGLMAPVFSKNQRLKNQDYLVKVLLKGIQGPLGNAETYSAGIMPPLENMYDDQQIADLANYLGFRWASWKKEISPEHVSQIRSDIKQRTTPWTFKELETK
ncbi:DUF7133 domain-containing protein [Rubritalea tangerina]|uniref:C-type cytochrome n=1 Tax=Rubritalea tangerina TaxID=430798 RepID=A0ABW4ZET0_9BACT